MDAIHSILVPVDFSEAAENAFSYALALAEQPKARVDLVYCIPPATDNNSPFMITPYSEVMKEARKKMQLFYHKCTETNNGEVENMPLVKTYIKYGDLKPVLNKMVVKSSIDLIVMGTKGRTGKWRSTFGTNASYLINKAPCPVIVVPIQAKFKPFRKICIATDLNDEATLRAAYLQQLFTPYFPEFHFLHICEKASERTAYDMSLLQQVFTEKHTSNTSVFASVVSREVVPGMLDYAADNHCELIVMNRPEKSWLERTFTSSHTREAILDAKLPILITRMSDLKGG